MHSCQIHIKNIELSGELRRNITERITTIRNAEDLIYCEKRYWPLKDQIMYKPKVNREQVTFIKALNYLNYYIPPLITIRRGSCMRFDLMKNTINIQLVGMMNPTKRFDDLQEFAPFLRVGTMQYCLTCGVLFNSQNKYICLYGLYIDD